MPDDGLLKRLLILAARYSYQIRLDLGLTATHRTSIEQVRFKLLGVRPTRQGRGRHGSGAPRSALDRRVLRTPEPAPAFDVLIYGPTKSPVTAFRARFLIAILEANGISFRLTHADAPASDFARYWIAPDAPRQRAPRIVFHLGDPAPATSGADSALNVYCPESTIVAPEIRLRVLSEMDIILGPQPDTSAMQSFGSVHVLPAAWAPLAAPPSEAEAPSQHTRVLFVCLGDPRGEHIRPAIEAVARLTEPTVAVTLHCEGEVAPHIRTMLARLPHIRLTGAAIGTKTSLAQSLAQADVAVIIDQGTTARMVAEHAAGAGVAFVAALEAVPPWLTEQSAYWATDVADPLALAAVLGTLDADVVAARRAAAGIAKAQATAAALVLADTLLGVAALRSLPAHKFHTRTPGIARLYQKPVELIDVYMTTSRRPLIMAKSLEALVKACDRSPFDHRITVMADQPDDATLALLARYRERIHLVVTPEQLGLPFMWNLVHDHSSALEARSERRADYLCYVQDDCLITDPDCYFKTMVDCHREILDPESVGYVSGFYCPIHPGFEKRSFSGLTVLLSDSIDGKNFMAPPRLIRQVGKLTWYFPNGDRRGNPGPHRGSHFDLWQWKESPSSLTKLGRASIVIPGLCSHIAQSSHDSTWGNSTLPEQQAKRVAEGRIYKTRKEAVPTLAPKDFYARRLSARDAGGHELEH